MSEGVSIVVCCHNSARLLPETLAHLAAQQFTDQRPASEVIVVDNASTDETSRIALESWPVSCPIGLKVVLEPKLGLNNARLRGIAEAAYSIVCFVDDDNRLNLDWVQIAFEVMSAHPEVGACGGIVEAQCEVTPPGWFHRFHYCYAIGKQSEQGGDATETPGFLWGAGLCLRKDAWRMVAENGFEFLLSDRKGASLSSGGDSEICYAVRLNGWRLWYEPRLQMKHFITANRLKWSYLRRANRGFGAATPDIDSYEMALRGKPTDLRARVRRTWGWQTLATVKDLLRKPLKLLFAPLAAMEGDADVLQIENLWGRLLELLRNRKRYGSNRWRMSSVKKQANRKLS